MALTVDEIAEILNTMRVENEHNVENFEKVLTGINNKLELMADDNEATDLIKLYLSELKKIVEDKYTDANERFSGIENYLKNIVSSQNEGAKTAELNDLSKVLSASFNALSSEFSHQASALNDLDSKLEIIRTSSFNKDELAGLLNNFASDISEMNDDFGKSFGKIQDSLADTIEKINNLDFSAQINSLEGKISSLAQNIDSVPAKISFATVEDKISYFQNIIDSLRGVISDIPSLSAEAVAKKFSDLEDNFKNIVSEADFTAFKSDLADFVQKIIDNSSALNSELSYSAEKIENILSTINSMDYTQDFDRISREMAELESAVNENIAEVEKNINTSISDVSEDILKKLDNFETSLSSIVSDSDFAGFKNDLADFVQKIIDNSSALNSELSYSAERIENILTTVKALDFRDDFAGIESRINDLKETFDEGSKVNYTNLSEQINTIKTLIDNGFSGVDTSRETVYNDLKNRINDIVSNLQIVINSNPQKSIDELSSVVLNLSENAAELRKNISTDIQGDYGDVKSSINAVALALQNVKEDIITKNTDYYNLSSENASLLQEKIDEQLRVLGDVKNLINEGNKFDFSEVTSSIDNINNEISLIISDLKEDYSSNYEAVKSYIEELSSAITSTREEFLNVAGQNSNLLSAKLDTVVSNVADFREEFKQAISSDVGNFSLISDDISGISEKIEKLQSNFVENSAENFNSVKFLLEEMAEKLFEDIEYQKKMFSDVSQNEEQKRLESVQKLTEDIQNLETILTTNNESFKSVIDENIKNIKEYIKEFRESLYTSQLEGENKFNVKLEALDVLNHGFETFVTDLNSQIQNVLDEIKTLDATKQNNEIQTELNNLKILCEGILTSTNDMLSRNDELASVISSLMEIVLKKGDINEISFKLDEYSDLLASLREFAEESFANNSSEINSLYERVVTSFENIVSREDFAEFKKDLSEFLQKVTDNSNILNADFQTNKEKIEEVIGKLSSIEPFDYSYDLEQISSKIDDLSMIFSSSSSANYEGISKKLDEIKSQIEENNKDEKITGKLDEVSELVNSVKDILSESVDTNSKSINEQLAKFEDEFSRVVTTDDFTNFRLDFGDFIQKILDNADVLHLNSDAAKEQINTVLDKLNTLNFSADFQNIDSRLNDIKSSFDNNSKINCENIINEISILQTWLDDNLAKNSDLDKENYDKLYFSLTELSDNVNVLLDLSSHKQLEILDKISETIGSFVVDINENIDNGVKLNLEELKSSVSDAVSQITEVKQGFEDKTDNITFSLTSGFDNIKLSLENILTAFNALNDYLKDGYEKNTSDVLTGIETASEKINELKEEIHKVTTDYSDRIFTVMNEISDKFEGLSTGVADSVSSQMLGFKNTLSAISDNLQSMYGEYFKHLQDASEAQVTEINGISGSISELRSHVDEAIQSLKDYVTELNVAAKSSKSLSDSKFSEKLINLEAALANNADGYEEKIVSLQEKLSEFVSVIENSSSVAEEKIASSMNEIDGIKSDLASVEELINTLRLSSDEKSSQIIALLDTGIENVTVSVNEISNNAVQNIDASISKNISVLEDKLTILLNYVENLKDTNLKDLGYELNDRLSELKQELGLINTDITDALQTKLEDIIGAIEPVKSAVESFSGYDFDKLLDDVKSALETSFMNFSVDVNGELSAHSESVLRLEQAYKETFNKISVIEDCVSEDIQNSIELLNVTIETNTRNLRCGLEEKLDEYINDLKTHLDIVINDTKTLDSIDNLKDELSVKLDAVISEQENLAQQNNVITAGINTLGDSLKNYVQSACENTIDKYSPVQNKESMDALHQKLDTLVATTREDEILNSLFELEQKADSIGLDLSESINSIKEKIDVIEKDNSLILAFHELAAKVESFTDDNTLNIALKALSEKIDIIASDSAMDELHDKFDEFSSKLESYTDDSSIDTALKSLSEKIDVIASDSTMEELHDKFDEFSSKLELYTDSSSIDTALKTLSEKIDVIASDTTVEELYERFDEFSSEEDKLAEMLSTLHEKVDAIAFDGSDFDIEEEIDDIKSLIFEQRKYFEASSDEKAAAIDKYLRDVLLKLDNVDLEKNSEDIKDSIINTLVSLFEQISFVEESEDIKDFVEEKTDAINQNLIEVQNQLKQITKPSDDSGYSYTLQDVESDIAKLRLAINNMSDNSFESISDNIKKIVSSVEGLESTLTQDQIVDLKSDIEKLNEDILSISSRTNKLLLTSDESYKALNDGLNNFSSLVYKLEDRINYLDNSEVSERLERKIDNIQSIAVASANADKVFHQVMMYLGEWIDSTTENISSITDKTSEISRIKENIEELKEIIPEKSLILEEIENKFEEQELRIDRLEMKLEKILSTLEEKDNMMLNRKVDKIEKMLSRLGTNIEKLASYVDEE